MIHWDTHPPQCLQARAEAEEGAPVYAAELTDAPAIDCPTCVAEVQKVGVDLVANAGRYMIVRACTAAKSPIPKQGESPTLKLVAELAKLVLEAVNKVKAEGQLSDERVLKTGRHRYGTGGPRGELIQFPDQAAPEAEARDRCIRVDCSAEAVCELPEPGAPGVAMLCEKHYYEALAEEIDTDA